MPLVDTLNAKISRTALTTAAILHVVLFSCGAAFAQQASFDCAKAVLVDEKIICSDGLLAQKDGDLGKTYSALMASLDLSHQAALRADQHNWLLLRNNECGVTKQTKLTDTSTAGYVDCFLASYEERKTDLDNVKASPDKDPAEVSTPIRKSQFSDEEKPTSESSHIMEADILVGEVPQMAWSGANTLIALASLPESLKQSLYEWQPGHEALALSEPLDDTTRIEGMCLRASAATVIRRIGDKSDLESTHISLKLGETPAVPEWAQDASKQNLCGTDLNRRQVLSASANTLLDLGPLDATAANADDRFVTMQTEGKAIELKPPLRIDRRLSLRGVFDPKTNAFIISQQNRPSGVRVEVERRWAKSNCLAFWEVSAQSGDVKSRCIPFGPYVKEVPDPLPTKEGLFFAAGDAGLYELNGSGVIKVIDEPMTTPVLAPDQCLIAFTGAIKKAGQRSLYAVDACKLAAHVK